MKVIATYNKFRVCTISRFDGTEKPIKDGLGIEYQLQDGSWLVLAFCEYNESNQLAIQNVGERASLIASDPFARHAFRVCGEIAIYEVTKENLNENRKRS